jgi:hypothetical protein
MDSYINIDAYVKVHLNVTIVIEKLIRYDTLAP